MKAKRIKALTRYPVKALGGEELSEVLVNAEGLAYDRQWMLVDEQNAMITQRTIPQLTAFASKIVNDACIIYEKSQPKNQLSFNIKEITDTEVPTKVWDHEVLTQIASHSAGEWLTEQTGIKMKLVTNGHRFSRWTVKGETKLPVLFADGYPILVLSDEAIDFLNEKLDAPVGPDRFRANILLSGCSAHEEDRYNQLFINDVQLSLHSNCRRCQVICIDQESGKVNKEPTKTLSSYRKMENGIIFGKNAGVVVGGLIKHGDQISFA